uniref:Aminotransferase n=1 Tax=Marinobacter nauticus TaxID=2743 RepID=A0A455WBW0_MARNT|nr:aminotransferase [Marinobacter nauticus]
MPKNAATRIANLQQSPIRAMTQACERVNGINLGQGLGDLPPPVPVRQGAISAIERNISTYTPSQGLPELRQAIARKLARDNALTVDADSGIVVTNGATGAFASTLLALLNPGDGVLLPEPYYGYHLNTLLLSGNEPQFVPLPLPSLEIREEDLVAAIKPNTRAIVLCTPGNPSGKMLTRAEIESVERVANAYDLLVITDEIYEYLTYDGRPHISPASVGRLGERTVTISGFSKSFSITGWRLGFVAAPEAMAHAINLVNDLYYVCAPAPLQKAVASALEAPDNGLSSLGKEYQWRRDLICNGLARAGIPPLIPQGAYYVLADVSSFGYANATDAAHALLKQTGVAAIPGSAFFSSDDGERYLRFCYAKDRATLDKAVRQLQGFRRE